MPSVSTKQRNYIFYLRGKYKNKSDTPEDQKWIWNSDWNEIKKEDCEYMIPYISKFEEMSPPNVSLILHRINKAIKEVTLRMKSDRERVEYFKGYIHYLNSYINGDIAPSEVAELARKPSDIDDDTFDSGEIDASHYIMKVVRDSIRD